MKLKFILFPFVLFQTALFGSDDLDIQSTFQEGNEAYKSQEYQVALEIYKVIESEYESPQLLANMGNSYFQLGDLAEAIYYYSKSLKMDPGQKDVAYNLSIAKLKTVDKIDLNYATGLKAWWKKNLAMIGVDRLATFSIVFSILTLLLLAMFVLSRSRIWKMIGFYLGIGLLILSVGSLWSSLVAKNDVLKMSRGIVMKAKLDVKSAPTETSADVFVLHEGTEVLIKDIENGWYEISLGDDRVGWSKMSEVRGF